MSFQHLLFQLAQHLLRRLVLDLLSRRRRRRQRRRQRRRVQTTGCRIQPRFRFFDQLPSEACPFGYAWAGFGSGS